MKSIRDWILQILGLMLGAFPAFLLVFAPIFLIFALVLVASIGIIWASARSFFYGMLCAVLIMPGVIVGLVLTAP